MTNVLIVGATGSVGSVTRQYFLDQTTDQLTLMARHTDRLGQLDPDRERAVAGSVTDPTALQQALAGQEVVFAALSGDLPELAKALVTGMDQAGVGRLLFISSMGIYNEAPGDRGGSNDPVASVLVPYRRAADIVEASDLNYTVIRPGWFDNGSDTDYQLTHKGEPFGGHDVSRKSIADLGVRLAHDPQLGSHESLGINRR